MTSHRLSRAYRNEVRSVFKYGFNCRSFIFVICCRASSMSIYVINLIKINWTIINGIFYCGCSSSPPWRRWSNVMCITSWPITNNFSINFCASFFALSRVSRTRIPDPSPITNPSLSASKGLLAVWGLSFLKESALAPVSYTHLTLPTKRIV